MIGKRVRHRRCNLNGTVVSENGIMLIVKLDDVDNRIGYGYDEETGRYCLDHMDRRWVDVIEEKNMVDIIVYGTQAWRDFMIKIEKETNEELS